jgi:hypothetical protein
MTVLRNVCVLALLFVITSFSPSGFAQTGNASLSGRVTDPHGGIVPHTTVEAINDATNVKVTTESNSDGLYYFSALPPAVYRIVVSKDGFKQIIEGEVTLHTQDSLTMNFSLQIGSVTESVTVKAETINESPAVSMTVTREFVENMPLNGRSFQDLIQLAPGTVSSNGYYSIGGQRTDANNFTVDGVSANLGGYINSSMTNSQGPGLSGSSPSQTALGTTHQPVDTMVKTSHLFAPFPEPMVDAAFFDRFHAYIPGWEIPKMRPEFFTNQYGLIVDYLAEWMREMRKRTFGDSINKFFKLGRDLNQRDTIAVKRTVSGLLKLLYPHEDYPKDAVRRCVEYALESRRRVKEQLKKIGGMEFFDVHFSFIDIETLEEKFITVPEQGGGTLIPDGPLSPGIMHTVATGSGGHLGLYRLETQITSGNGFLKTSGLGSNSLAREAIKVGFDFFKANASRISASIKVGEHDYHLHVVELHNSGPTAALTLSTFVTLCSGVMGKPIQQQMVVLGSMSLGGNVVPVENLAESLQVALDSGARRILLPMASVRDIPTIPGELFAKFQTSFYSDPTDAVFKALGVQ